MYLNRGEPGLIIWRYLQKIVAQLGAIDSMDDPEVTVRTALAHVIKDPGARGSM